MQELWHSFRQRFESDRTCEGRSMHEGELTPLCEMWGYVGE